MASRERTDGRRLTRSFGHTGYRLQRNYLARKYQGAATAKQLWTVQQLRESKYERGTQLTDHFEVIEKTKTEIMVRCGDSPRNAGPRPSDGLFIIGTHVVKARGEVVLELKSVFFDSSRKIEGIHSSVPSWIEYPHRWYSRLLLETASWNLTR